MADDGGDLEPQPGRVARLRRLLRDLGPAAPLFFVACAGPLLGVLVVAATVDTWVDWFGDDAGSVVAFWLLGAAMAAGCLLPTHATSLVAGYLFGVWLGSLLAWLVVVLAAAIGFSIWTRLCGSRAVQAIAHSPKAVRVHDALLGRGYWRTVWLITLLRLSPVMPFAGTNLLMAAFGVRASVFLLATVIGTTPRAIAVAVIGGELSELDWTKGGNVWTTVVAIAATVVAVVVVGRIARAALRREVGDVESGEGEDAAA